MSFGKLYGFQGNARSMVCLALAKENNLDIEFVETVPPVESADYKLLNPLGRVPTFEAANGWVLTESIAISIYFASQNEKTTLLGKTKQDYAQIVRWMSFVNAELLPHLGGWFRPLIGKDAYNKANVEKAQQKANEVAKVLDSHFLVNTFFVGERITLADIYGTSLVSRGFQYVFDKAWRAEFPNLTRWYETMVNQPIWKAVVPEATFVDEAVKYTPPKKEPKPAKAEKEAKPAKAEKEPKPAKAEKAAAAANDDEDDEPKPEQPKAKHPLESLGKPTMILDDWKRKYSNEDTPVALKWFWENYNADEYSLYKVDYKYNEELTLPFMSANLIGGLFARLEASRKYLFGAMSVYGVANDSIITGAFLVRGQDAAPAFDVAPDWESYEFTKLDPSKDKEFIDEQWSWEKPVVVGGKEYPHADGKVFK